MVAAIVRNQRSFVYNNGATIFRHKNSKWRRPGNFNAKTADIHIQIFGTLKLFFGIYFATHKQHYKELIKRRKEEEERMMTIVARRPKGSYKVHVC